MRKIFEIQVQRELQGLFKVTGMLLQTKVYLFWRKSLSALLGFSFSSVIDRIFFPSHKSLRTMSLAWKYPLLFVPLW
jgi:hypothetical protein